MTPLELDICLHYHSSCIDLPWCVETDSPAPCQKSTMAGLVSDGLLVRERPAGAPGQRNRDYYPTDKLHAFVELLCKTPLPVREWIDPRDGKPARRSVVNDCATMPFPK